jgi:hypothetical protein
MQSDHATDEDHRAVDSLQFLKKSLPFFHRENLRFTLTLPIGRNAGGTAKQGWSTRKGRRARVLRKPPAREDMRCFQQGIIQAPKSTSFFKLNRIVPLYLSHLTEINRTYRIRARFYVEYLLDFSVLAKVMHFVDVPDIKE